MDVATINQSRPKCPKSPLMVSHLLPKKRPGKFPPNFFILSPQMPKVAPISISMSTLLLKKEIKGFYSLSSSISISQPFVVAVAVAIYHTLTVVDSPHPEHRCLATPPSHLRLLPPNLRRT